MRMTKLVVSFNRHFFAIALSACAVAAALLVALENPILRACLALGIGCAIYFMIASVIAAYGVYDASDLYQLRWWPARCLSAIPSDGIVVHAGFDPASPALQTKFPEMHLRILNFHDSRITTEASIQRANRLNPPTRPEEKIAASAWPVAAATQDAVFALSAAHELRRPHERLGFFREAKRVLKGGGKIIVIEQMRDFVNFACFGPAAFHFLSRRTWLQSFAAADLTVADEFKITPFMTAFVLE